MDLKNALNESGEQKILKIVRLDTNYNMLSPYLNVQNVS